MSNALTHSVRTESLAERSDGEIVAYAEPVPCDCCGKLCTVKVIHLSNGDRVGTDCAAAVDFVSKAVGSPGGSPFSPDALAFYGYTRRQARYITALGLADAA